MRENAEIVVCGAGMAGLSAAYHLAVRNGVRNVVVVDEREPLTLTSDKGTQGYRNWWPGPDDTMLRYVSRSIDLLEEIADETNNVFRLNRRGYLFVTSSDEGVGKLRTNAAAVSAYGMGDVREHTAAGSYHPAEPEGYEGALTGADLLLGDEARRVFPYLRGDTAAALHVRRAGWMNSVALGDLLIRRCVGAGVRFVRDRVSGIDEANGEVRSVRLSSGATIATNRVVLAAGPMLPEAGRMLGIDLPLVHELHAKVTFNDTRGIIPRWSPFTIWIDEMSLTLDGNARAFPGGVHARPVDGPRGDEVWFIWTYDTTRCAPVWPPRYDAEYGDACLRGLAHMMPAMAGYLASPERGVTDGGYYCKTTDNRPLIGALPVQGAFVFGGLSGSGIMSSLSGGELVAAHVLGNALPAYAGAFDPTRYEDSAYAALVAHWGALAGQL
ncbi:MAG: FAD-dependent oxidoreductase [Gemmatimonadaceae bacterium]